MSLFWNVRFFDPSLDNLYKSQWMLSLCLLSSTLRIYSCENKAHLSISCLFANFSMPIDYWITQVHRLISFSYDKEENTTHWWIVLYKIKNEDIIKIKYFLSKFIWFQWFNNAYVKIKYQHQWDFLVFFIPKFCITFVLTRSVKKKAECMQCLMLWWPQTSCKSVTNLKHTQLVTSLWLYIIKCSSQLCMITFKKRQKAIHIYIQNKKKV